VKTLKQMSYNPEKSLIKVVKQEGLPPAYGLCRILRLEFLTNKRGSLQDNSEVPFLL
jgi:hypothetical protein